MDDNPAIHEDFRKILGAKTSVQSRLADVESALFGSNTTAIERASFRIESAFQGQEALALVQKAEAEGDPFVMAFVDIRMPPGWDGVETLERIWQDAPELQAVICTAYSDYSWDDMVRKFGYADKLVILKKPFETVEVLQLAHALTRKWSLGHQAKLRVEDLDHRVQQRTEELLASNKKLHLEIEERAKIQEALRLSEERFSKAFKTSPIAMAILQSSDCRFLDINQVFEELTGYTSVQILQHTQKDLQLLTKSPELVDADAFSLEDRLRNQSCVLRRSDGTFRQALVSTEPLELGGIHSLIVTVEDVTEQLKLESQLRQSQKMEVVGRMSAGIAHEFNNLLTVIQGDVGLLKSVKLDAAGVQALLDQIMQASLRAANLTRQLLAFSRKQVLQPKRLNISEVVQNMKKMLGRLISEKFEIRMQCPNELPPVLADEGGIEQILVNLVLNARDSMPTGGIIQIETEATEWDETTVSRHPDARTGKFVCLTVSDRGCGMEAKVLNHIFEPFFTTKEVGKGTGLGLSTILGIVKQHDGWIDVSSEVGRGSSFRIYLPACNGIPAPRSDNHTDYLALRESGQGETVLVVEDESSVCDLACSALEKHGYKVIRAADGPEAIQAWERSSEPVDLLLTDIVMPSGMSGSELAKELQTRNAQLKIIFTSGYSTEIIHEDSFRPNEINFLPKPYDLQTLLKSVRQCLNSGTPGRSRNSSDLIVEPTVA